MIIKKLDFDYLYQILKSVNDNANANVKDIFL